MMEGRRCSPRSLTCGKWIGKGILDYDNFTFGPSYFASLQLLLVTMGKCMLMSGVE